MYEVLDYPIKRDEEVGSIDYWFGRMPTVVKAYKTKRAAIQYAKTYAQQVQRGVEVSFEAIDRNEISTFHQYFYP
jgi:hypothetical protein